MTVEWAKSSYSNTDGGNCVEWAPSVVASSGQVPVRDSKVHAGPTLTLSPSAWSSFVEYAKAAQV
ncbi:DUF397 domain-containing protein [Streptomyces sp. NPDC001822]|uniref:DUF397 domain-containing protein n=1 Tax=Streptomyces sp. NPDC001822 TaxID=3364614 RepID=UPI0036A31CCE